MTVSAVRPGLRVGLVVAALGIACTQRDGILGKLGSSGSSGVCKAESPVVTLHDQQTCTGRLAASLFSSALCVCNNLQLPNDLITRGFDSSQGPYKDGPAADHSGAAVGVNGSYSSFGSGTDIAGSFTVAGPGALQFLGSLYVRGDLRVGGNMSVVGAATVWRDAYLAGSFTGLGLFSVYGRLVHAGPVMGTLLPPPPGGNQQEAVTITPPCPCGDSDLLDVAGLVDNAQSDNDNSGLSPDVLAAINGNQELALCGRIYLSEISGTGDVLVHVNGPSAVFIDGSINLQGSLTFRPVAGAELDVFVRHDVSVKGPISLADQTPPTASDQTPPATPPSAGRMAVGGSQPIPLAGPAFVGNLYAPRARVTAATAIEVVGAIFASDFQGASSALFVFDRSIVNVGGNCSAPQPPPGLCSPCEWCTGGTACVGGVCTLCQSDSDCCGQSACENHTCVPLIR
jgi:hypothetical protein